MKKILFVIFLFWVKLANSQLITTVAGNGTCCSPVDGVLATESSIYSPNGVAADAFGNFYISEANKIRKVNTSGIISTIAGSTGGYSGDGEPAINAHLESSAVVVDIAGNIYSADWFHNVVRKINTGGIISTIAGNGAEGFSGDGGPATSAELNGPYGLAVDALGNLYISDSDNGRVRKVNSSGIITTVAGNGTVGFGGDGGLATAAALHSPIGIALDGAGNLYIADWQNNRIRKVNSFGIISTIAGNGTGGFSGDGGQATAAELHEASGVAHDEFGNLYISDDVNNRIRMVNAAGIISTIAGNGTYGISGDGGAAINAELAMPWNIALDASGNLYLNDGNHFLIRKVSNVTGIDPVIDIPQKITTYPNPFSSQTLLKTNNLLKNATLTVNDYFGHTVKQVINISEQSIVLRRDNLPIGLYYLQLIQDDKIIATGKLLIID